MIASLLGMLISHQILAGSPEPPPPLPLKVEVLSCFPASVLADPEQQFDGLPVMLPGRWLTGSLDSTMRAQVAAVINTRLQRGGLDQDVGSQKQMKHLLASTAERLSSTISTAALAEAQTRAFDNARPSLLPLMTTSWRDMFVLDHLADWRLATMATWLVLFKDLQEAPEVDKARRTLATIEALARMSLPNFLQGLTKPQGLAAQLRIDDDQIGEMLVTRAAAYTLQLSAGPDRLTDSLSSTLDHYFATAEPAIIADALADAERRNTASDRYFWNQIHARQSDSILEKRHCTR